MRAPLVTVQTRAQSRNVNPSLFPNGESGDAAGEGNMRIEVQDLEGGVCLVALAGAIDIIGAQQLDTPMTTVANTHRAVVIDLSGVAFIASMGLRALIHITRSVNARGGKVALLNPGPGVTSVLETNGIGELIPVFHDLQSAVQAVTAP
jgi:anti-sigma B factor antagonist